MEQNKDQSGAVRALPSDLTEREEIDLLCQVETYMSVTDKHSQTHPEAEAEEARIYSLVNGLIAKRFSDIGAAVRGEAVADHKTRGLLMESLGWIESSSEPAPSLCADIRKYLGLPVSARAADAPSEPSERGYPVYLAWNDQINAWVDVGLAEYLAADVQDRRVAYEPQGAAA